MQAFMTALIAEVTSADLWAELAPAAVFIGAMVLFAFGYNVIRKLIKGASKGKARV